MTHTEATLNTGKRCQCPSCLEYFSTEANFDRHRRGVHGVDRRCIYPGYAGLVIGQSGANTQWQMPASNPHSATEKAK
jgi:hypothetical protein